MIARTDPTEKPKARILIVDGEAHARRDLMELLTAHPGIALVGEAPSLSTALPQIAEKRPDAIFLDLGPQDTSDVFDLIARLEAPPRIVFVTAHAPHAVTAFSLAALDFLLKPVSPQRLAETLRRLEQQLAATRPAVAVLELRMPGRSLFVEADEIAALRADGDFTHVLLAGQPPVMVLRSLSSFEVSLPTGRFLRVGRSLILNLTRLRAVDHAPRGGGTATLSGLPEPVSLNRNALRRLRQLLG